MYLKKFGLNLDNELEINDTSSNANHYMANVDELQTMNSNPDSLQIGTIQNRLKPNYDALKQTRRSLNNSFKSLVKSSLGILSPFIFIIQFAFKKYKCGLKKSPHNLE